ncbi:MAG: beta-L-arabinofuranosidase domain-containing protein, partial [Janthinobacterium lividum]
MKNLKSAPLKAVTIDDTFWSERQRVNREATIPAEYAQCEITGRIKALTLAPVSDQHIFWDSDVAKWIEAASYSLATHPDSEAEALVDDVVRLLADAQQPDGYLNTYFTTVAPERRWANLRDDHELYCAGHLIEAGVAHFQATGKTALLDVVRRYADYIGSVFGTEEGRKRGYCGHEEIELALVKLADTTGESKYQELARYFVDERGRQPHYFDKEARARGEDPKDFWFKNYEYNQSHEPVRDQDHVTGHAVRGMYLYTAMADLAAR